MPDLFLINENRNKHVFSTCTIEIRLKEGKSFQTVLSRSNFFKSHLPTVALVSGILGGIAKSFSDVKEEKGASMAHHSTTLYINTRISSNGIYTPPQCPPPRAIPFHTFSRECAFNSSASFSAHDLMHAHTSAL